MVRYPPKPKSSAGSLLSFLTVTTYSALSFPREVLKSYIAEYFPQAKERLILAQNGADPLPPDLGQGSPVSRRAQRLMVGFLGDLYSSAIIKILAGLAKRCPWADFHILGDCPKQNALGERGLNSKGNVFLHGEVPYARVAGYLQAFDILIAPYQDEISLRGGLVENPRWTCPLRLFDCMFAGKPLICSDLPGVREIFVHNRNALLCPPTDVKAWARALHRLRARPELTAKLAACALDKVSRKTTWTARATLFLKGLTFTVPRPKLAKLRVAYVRNGLSLKPNDFVLYRVIGNDLIPRHRKGQSIKNLRFILENETEFRACEKRWVVNRIFDRTQEQAVINLLEEHNQPYLHLPFVASEYRHIGLDTDALPPGFLSNCDRVSNIVGIERAITACYRLKNNYVMNNNGARNAALREGKQRAKWVMPWDGNCFITPEAWKSITTEIKHRPWLKYFAVPDDPSA